MASVVDALNGAQKAAILLMQMSREASGKVLSQMREVEVEAVMAEVVRLQDVDPEIADQVLAEFHELATARRFVVQGGSRYARELLESAMGGAKATAILTRISDAMKEIPFEFLRRADSRQILSFLQDEHPQTIALVLAHMGTDQASAVLGGLPPVLQSDVAHRIVTMDRTSPEIIKTLETSLEQRLSSVLQPAESSKIGGIAPLVNIISRADRATERLILEGLEGRDPALAEEIRSHMFMFEDITTLDDRSVQLLLRQVEPVDLATALKGVRSDVREKIAKNLSERAGENLLDEIELLGPVRLRAVEECQAKIVQLIRALEESGDVVLRRGAGDDFVI